MFSKFWSRRAYFPRSFRERKWNPWHPPIGDEDVNFDGVRESVLQSTIRYIAPFNLVGLPALSTPCGFFSGGLPIGMQIVGRPFEESTVLRAGFKYQQATDWQLRFPSIS